MGEFEIGKWLWTIFAPSHFLLLILAIAVFTSHRWINAFFAGLVTLTLLIIAILPVGDWALMPLETCAGDKPKIPSQVNGVIVLGGTTDERISSIRGKPEFGAGSDRFLTMLELMRTYPQASFIYTGGSGLLQYPNYSEADTVKKAMGELGVDSSRVIFETKARNTAQNAEYTLPHYTNPEGQNWLIVTSAYHMPRALSLFEQASQGRKVNFWPYPVDYKTPGRFQVELSFDLPGNLGKLDSAAKEYVGMAYNHFVMGRTPSFLTCREIKRVPTS